MFENLMYINFSTVSMSIMAMVFLRFNVVLDKRSSKLFQIALMLLLILSVTDSVYFYYWNIGEPTFLEEVCANAGYIIRPAIMFVIFEVVNKSKRRALLQCTPLIINIVILLQNFITHNVFYFSDYNELTQGHIVMHGPLGYTPHIISALYAIMITASAIKYFQLSNMLEMITLFFCLFICIIATYCESVYDMWGLVRQSIAMYIVLYMLHSHMIISNRDVLTKVYNRYAFSHDISRNYDKIYAIVSADLNDLKKYNDTYGHTHGDKALIKITEIFSKICPSVVKIYRTGGDEFVFLVMRKTKKSVEAMIDEIQAELSKTEYRCAFGISYVNEFDSFDEAFEYADMMMYKNKASMKKDIRNASGVKYEELVDNA